MGRQSRFRHLAQVARAFRNRPGRSQRSSGPRRTTIHVQVSRTLLGTLEDHEHFDLKLGLLRALRLACPEIDILVEDFDADAEPTERVAVVAYYSTKTMRNRAVRVVERSVEEGTWRAFARRSDAPFAASTVDACEMPDVAIIQTSASGSDDGSLHAGQARQAHISRAASRSQPPPPST